MTIMARVLLENISKVFEGNVVAVNEANLDIQDKEFMVIVGPSSAHRSLHNKIHQMGLFHNHTPADDGREC